MHPTGSIDISYSLLYFIKNDDSDDQRTEVSLFKENRLIYKCENLDSSSQHSFNVLEIEVGDYTVKFEKPGFHTFFESAHIISDSTASLKAIVTRKLFDFVILDSISQPNVYSCSGDCRYLSFMVYGDGLDEHDYYFIVAGNKDVTNENYLDVGWGYSNHQWSGKALMSIGVDLSLYDADAVYLRVYPMSGQWPIWGMKNPVTGNSGLYNVDPNNSLFSSVKVE